MLIKKNTVALTSHTILLNQLHKLLINKFDSTACQFPCTIYKNQIRNGINNPSRSITKVISTIKILKTYLERFKYKIFFFKWTIQICNIK